MKAKVAAVIVAYNDYNSLFKCVDSLYEQVDFIIIVDNSSHGAYVAYPKSHIYIKNEMNLGLAKGLNIGIKKALELGVEWILLLDQDSILEKNMISNMIDSYNLSSEKSKIAQIVPTIYDNNMGRYIPSLIYKTFYLKKIFKPISDCFVDFQVTSGSLIHNSIFKEIGLMDNNLFIDYIDFDYCFRIRKYNYKILLSKNAHLHHALGEKKIKGNISFIEHPSFRIYYQMRNRIIVMKRFKKEFPFFVIREINKMVLKFFKILILESEKKEKIKNYFKGIYEGILFDSR